MRNTEFIFIPFSIEKQDDLYGLIDYISTSDEWELTQEKIAYLLKYVTDNINNPDPEKCQCYHFKRKGSQDEISKDMGIFRTKTSPSYSFSIEDVQLFCFKTCVCIIVLRLSFDTNDPLHISSALYSIKKVSRSKIITSANSENSSGETTMLEFAKSMLSGYSKSSDFSYFYYANKGTERANVLSYIEKDQSDDELRRKELYYLRWCFNEDFIYTCDPVTEENETFVNTSKIVWGFSPEAAVCHVTNDSSTSEFIDGKFYHNFQTQYMFMYVLLLHQKYVLYRFLMKVGVGLSNDLPMLEEYRQELYNFEMNYIFSCITEVPQYQKLYNKMYNIFSLDALYKDVHEPLLSMSDIRHEQSEEYQKERDGKLNRAVFILSLLGFASALTDSYSFVEDVLGDLGFGRFIPVGKIADVVIMLIFGALIIGQILSLFTVKRKKIKDRGKKGNADR